MFHGGSVGHIGAHRNGAAMNGVEISERAVEFRGRPPSDSDRSVLPRQGEGNCAADSTSAARDDGDSFGQAPASPGGTAHR
jgi:hypothetical protein